MHTAKRMLNIIKAATSSRCSKLISVDRSTHFDIFIRRQPEVVSGANETITLAIDEVLKSECRSIRSEVSDNLVVEFSLGFQFPRLSVLQANPFVSFR